MPITECCPSDLTDSIRQGTGHASLARDDALAAYLGILKQVSSDHLEVVNGRSDNTVAKRKMKNTQISTKYYTEN